MAEFFGENNTISLIRSRGISEDGSLWYEIAIALTASNNFYILVIMTEKMKKSLRFVTKFYSPGALRPDDSFITEGLSFWKRHTVAASIIGVTLLAAAAGSAYLALSNTQQHTDTVAMKDETPVTPNEETPRIDAIKEMKFEEASLPEVVKAIEDAYGVKVAGKTEGQPNLTLSYKGTAEELVAAINDLLGTNLRIEK